MDRRLLMFVLLVSAGLFILLTKPSEVIDNEIVVDAKHWKNERYYRYTDAIRNEDGSLTQLLRPTAPSHVRAPNQAKLETFTNGRNEHHKLNKSLENREIPSVDDVLNEVHKRKNLTDAQFEGINVRRPIGTIAAFKHL